MMPDGEGLPDRTPLTLAEVVSWVAWGRAFTREDFRLAGGRDWLREKIGWLEADGRTGDELAEARGELSRAEAMRAEMDAAASGAEYGSEAYADALGRAAARLFDAARAERLTVAAKRYERNARWTQVPKAWFWTDQAEPRQPVVILGADQMTREGDTPLWQIVGADAHDAERVNDWYAVRFEREDVLRAFTPEAPASRGTSPAARKRGHSFREADQPLIREMHDLIKSGQASNPRDAARAVVGKALGKGEPQSKVERLANLYWSENRPSEPE